jgi:hypothetical protein
VDIIQEVGSYAGFAAVVGLAVLAALYFSQARDVRRLRDWAGRAPERAADQALPGQTVLPEQAAQEAVRPVPSGAVRPIPAAKPASAAAAGAKPATAAANAGQGDAAAPGAAKPEAKAAGAAPSAGAPAPATPAAAPAQGRPGAPAVPAKPGGPPVPGKPGAVPAGATPVPARPPAVPSRPGPVGRSPAASQSTAVLPASTRTRDPGVRSGRGRRDGLDARYIALIVAGLIVVGGGAAFGISQLGDDDKPASGSDQSDAGGPAAPINPTTVTVSVLNGTTVPGLAAQIGDEVESAGFQRGNVANAIDQQRPTSVVLFAEGADREARLVGRRLGIARVEPVDPDSQALAGNASVVVIVGTDQTQ